MLDDSAIEWYNDGKIQFLLLSFHGVVLPSRPLSSRAKWSAGCEVSIDDTELVDAMARRAMREFLSIESVVERGIGSLFGSLGRNFSSFFSGFDDCFCIIGYEDLVGDNGRDGGDR